jgi:hypothetical protein
LGIGQWLASPWIKRLPMAFLLLGTLLPDLIDKPLYYGLVWLTGHHGAALGLVSGTRSFAHSLLFLALLALSSWIGRSKKLAALAAGSATHLLLDNLFEPFMDLTIYSSRIALFFPFYGGRFPVAQHHSLGQHIAVHMNYADFVAETIGLILLARLIWQARNKKAARPPLSQESWPRG